MRVSVENVSNLGRKMTVAIPADEIEQRVDERLRELSKTVNLPGFRPGKIPKKVIDRQFGRQVMQEIAGDMIQTSWAEAVGNEGLNPATGPAIEPKSLERGADFEYTASFDVLPEIPTPDIVGVTIEQPVCTISDADIDKTLDRMRQNKIEYKAKEGAAVEKDQVTIDFVGKVNGEPFDGGASEDFPLVLGSGAVLKDLEDGLLGVSANDQKTVDVAFPENYPSEELAGSTAQFDVTVKEVGEPVMPEIDDDFAVAFGIEEGGVAKLREEIKLNLERERDSRTRDWVRNKVMDALFERNKIDLPSQLVEQEIDSMIEQMQQSRTQQGLAPDESVDRDPLVEPAARRVALGLIVREVIDKHEITPDAVRVRERVTEMAAGDQESEQFIQWYYSDQERLGQVQSLVMEEQVVELLLGEATIEEKPMELADLIDPGHDHDHDHDHDHS